MLERTDRFIGTRFSKATGPNMMINISRLDCDDQVSCLASGGFRTGLLLLPRTWQYARSSKWSYSDILRNRTDPTPGALITLSFKSGAHKVMRVSKDKKKHACVCFSVVFCGGQWCVSGLTTCPRTACAGRSVYDCALQVCTNSTGPKQERWHFWLTTGEIQLQTVLSVPVLTWAGGSSPSTKVCPWPWCWAIDWPSPILYRALPALRWAAILRNVQVYSARQQADLLQVIGLY